ncbi:hypothetical protein Y032_0214g2337 [Ancylostoma ceylanicum]|uniref:protein-tyrosine-phosphatase n=1 Tax=Ancylostoma ceylanicum TaxID=53326 RepID=A0A016SJH7_9BILA|nr:hypothetical protein Y032_0214g2337 [Ancylostoma ceylanicum]
MNVGAAVVMVTASELLTLAFAIVFCCTESHAVQDVPSKKSLGDELDKSQFAVQKDARLPHSQLTVELPQRHPSYDQFIAKVVDISPSIDPSIRDVNRTFLESGDDSGTIRIHTLHPGHKYSVAIIGRRGESSSLIKEEAVTMDPRTPQFSTQNIEIAMHNITLKAEKPEKNVQDSFLVEYRQLDPEQRYPILEVLDIPEQRNLEVYLGNLNPGRDYHVQVVAMKSGLKSRPWSTTLSTMPSAVSSLSVSENGTSCLEVEWNLSPNSGTDSFILRYAQLHSHHNSSVTLPEKDRSIHLCDGILPGTVYTISVAVKKRNSVSEEKVVTYAVRPLAPTDFKISPDITKGKYRLTAELSTQSKYDGCHVSVVSETLEKVDANGELEDDSENKSCNILLALIPGERFEFTLSTFSNNVTSSKLHRSVVLTPAFDMSGFGLSLQESKNGLELSWPQSDVFMSRLKDIWNKVVGLDSTLQMRLFPTVGASNGRRLSGDPLHASPLVMGGLTKGACYKIQIFTVTKSGIVSETRFNEHFRLSAPPVNVSVNAITRTSAALQAAFVSAEDADGECFLNIVVLDMHSHVVLDKTLRAQSNAFPGVELNGLRPFHKYTVNNKITCTSGPADCLPSSRSMRQLTFSTMQDRPGPVLSLSVRALNPYSAQLSWLPPALPNGILTHYIVDVTKEGEPSVPRSLNVGVGTDRADHFVETVVDGLAGGERYNFVVRAATEAGSGDLPSNSPEFIKMPIMAPPRTNLVPSVAPESITSHSLTVKYSSAMFDAKHGKITKSALLVAEVTEDGRVSETWMNSENVTYTWMQVQRFDVWPLYTAVVDESPPDQLNSITLTQAVGVDQTCEDLPADTVCNGPLKAGTNYKFKLRLFTAPNLFSDTDFSAVVSTDPSPRGATLKLAALVLVVAVLLGVLGILFTTYWNRSKKARAAYASSKESQWAALKMVMAERAADCLAKLGLDGSIHNGSLSAEPAHLQASFGHHRRCRSLRERTGVDHRLERLPSGPIHKTPLYTVVTGVNTNKSRPVKIADFAEHVRMMAADSDFRFSEEYEILRNVGCGQSYNAAELPANKAKNRFTNILPYDHSRVRLAQVSDQEGADYVNANYMPGFSSRREFIAAQGPLPTTRDAFWQMAWEQGCPAIIALTKCVEKGRDKCHQYWPDNEHSSVVYADIEVTVLSESTFDDFTIRELRMKKLHESAPPRTIRHFHYMAWPDFGVPDHPEGIIRFALKYRSRIPHSPQNRPTIVHCSAGVGRSGTFIAIDRLLQTIQIDRPIDVFGIVHEMRLERCHMVQNEQQYIFIHHCILHAIETMAPDRSQAAPSELHQNPVFEDDDTIAESDF